MRATVAGVLGMAMIALASPAMAATSEPTPSETPAVTATPSPTANSLTTDLAGSTATPTPGLFGSVDPSATPSLDPSATPSIDPSATPTVDPNAITAPTVTTSPTSGTGNPALDGFLDLLPFKVPLDKQINGIEDFEVNPLFLTFTCTDGGPAWKLKNTSDRAFGFGWFDTNLGGGILEIGPKQTVDINSKALAVIGSPWDAKTKVLLVTVPTVGVSDCAGTAALVAPAAAPAPLPVAVPAAASAVSAEPYYTR
jgi:hypothetical protein